ncbi:MAG: hypothetical protein JNN32_05550 [Flavobacteriales bacterium]|nr:hypothetical protein [Flavobacteriales bacterium]
MFILIHHFMIHLPDLLISSNMNTGCRSLLKRNKHQPDALSLWVHMLLSIFIHIAAFDGMAQPPIDTTEYAKTTIFASGLGNGGIFSFNIDRRWRLTGERSMSLSAGLTYFPLANEPISTHVFSLPLQWNWFKGQVHHHEHGAGLTFGRGWFTGSTNFGERLVSNGIYFFAKPFGYRYQRDHGGFFFRAYTLAWVRIIELNRRYVEEYGFWETPPVFPWVGFDLGYTFRHRHNTDRP